MSDSPDSAAAPGRALAPADPAASALPALDAHGYDPADYDWVPVLRKPRADGWTPQKQRAFIGELADSGNVTKAAHHVAMSPSSAYALRRAPGGEAFAAAWDAAIHQAAHALVDLAFDRAFNGSDEPVWDRDGRVIGRRHRQSDAMIMFLLRKHFPGRYGDLHRDRPERIPAPETPAVAATLTALGPVQPPDPLAGVEPDEAEVRFALADMLDGELPQYQRQDGSVEREAYAAAAAYVNPEFEALLEAAKREANPAGWAKSQELKAFYAEQEAEERQRRSRRRRR